MDETPAAVHTHTHTTKHRRLKNFIKIVCFLVIFCILLWMASKVTSRKNAYQYAADFFEQEEDFDVLFYGSSHTLNGIFPMDLWNDYGIVSYNLGYHSEHMSTTYYNILLSLQETNPKLVVVDAYYIFSDTVYGSDSNLHNVLDLYPISIEKYNAIKDLYYEAKEINNEEELKDTSLFDMEIEFLFPFTMYHSRWDEITKNDFKVKSLYEKGAESRINVAQSNIIIDFDSVEIYDGEETINMRDFRKMIKYCKENDIELLITYLPETSSERSVSQSKYVEKICKEYNVNYINFMETPIINYKIDYYDSENCNSHLNPSGARKVTDYIGKYIMQDYNVSDQRSNEAYSFWYEDYDEYIDLKIKNLKNNRKDLNNYLMLLYDEKDIEYEIKVQSTLKIEEDSILYYLLENLDNNYEIDDAAFMELNEKTGEYELKEKTIKITTWDKRTDKQLDEVWF